MENDTPGVSLQLDQCPLTGIAAVTARCLRRVRPLLPPPGQYVTADFHSAVDQTIAMLEAFAASGAGDTLDVAEQSGLFAGITPAGITTSPCKEFFHAVLPARFLLATLFKSFECRNPDFRELTHAPAANLAASVYQNACTVMENGDPQNGKALFEAAVRSDVLKVADLSCGAAAAAGAYIDASEQGPRGVLWPSDPPT
jgi:hypothetical protein